MFETFSPGLVSHKVTDEDTDAGLSSGPSFESGPQFGFFLKVALELGDVLGAEAVVDVEGAQFLGIGGTVQTTVAPNGLNGELLFFGEPLNGRKNVFVLSGLFTI